MRSEDTDVSFYFPLYQNEGNNEYLLMLQRDRFSIPDRVG